MNKNETRAEPRGSQCVVGRSGRWSVKTVRGASEDTQAETGSFSSTRLGIAVD